MVSGKLVMDVRINGAPRARFRALQILIVVHRPRKRSFGESGSAGAGDKLIINIGRHNSKHAPLFNLVN